MRAPAPVEPSQPSWELVRGTHRRSLASTLVARITTSEVEPSNREFGGGEAASDSVRFNAFQAASMYTGMAARMVQLIERSSVDILPFVG